MAWKRNAYWGVKGKEVVVEAVGEDQLGKRTQKIKGMSTEKSLRVMGKEKGCGQQRLRRKGQRVSMCVPESKGRKNFKERSRGRSCQCPHHGDRCVCHKEKS